ncbi:hypothetical protein [Robinsoniella peoriensis]|uniref:Uncharacterized protein n=1 Tax=Robinsoniella peoriensis TaxID=180332 RepID=A0A4U8Q4L5_9FIRM|nr:hypothetical protein [Robinsoniella peoriensis]TLC99173.1 hypothetical protein DSM106044_03951 [Robinsoniella peoriensis]
MIKDKAKCSLDLLAYDNSKPVWFFVVAFILFLVGAIRVYCKIISIYRDGLCIGEFISSLVSIVLIIIFLILLFTFIDNPILRAIFVVVGGGIAAIFAFTK